MKDENSQKWQQHEENIMQGENLSVFFLITDWGCCSDDGPFTASKLSGVKAKVMEASEQEWNWMQQQQHFF